MLKLSTCTIATTPAKALLYNNGTRTGNAKTNTTNSGPTISKPTSIWRFTSTFMVNCSLLTAEMRGKKSASNAENIVEAYTTESI